MRNSRGFSLIEVLIVVAIILILAAISVPGVLHSRRFAADTAAGAEVRAIHLAQAQYIAQYGRFAASLGELGPPAAGAAPSASAGQFIGPDLANGEKGGYRFTLTATPSGYVVQAVPVSFGVTGNKTLYSDQNMTVHVNNGPEPATAQSPPMR